MDYENPLRAAVSAQSSDVDILIASLNAEEENLAWFDGFDESERLSRAAAADALIVTLDQECAAAHDAVAAVEVKARAIRARAENLQYQIKSSMPFAWIVVLPAVSDFLALRRLKAETTALKSELLAATEHERGLISKRDQAVEYAGTVRSEITRFNSFDRDSAQAHLAELRHEVFVSGERLEVASARATALDEQIASPLKELRNQVRELGEAERRMKAARNYLDRLKATSDKTERWKIHKESELVLGDSDLREVIHEAQGAVRPLKRTIPKLESQIEKIIREGTIDVQKLVIDGSNLRTVDNRFIGLGPLRAVLTHMAGKAEVVVFFDRGIVGQLGLPSAEKLSAMLPNVKYHITAPDTPADQSILRAAEEPGAYVLSNDMYRDFKYMNAVKEDRVLRHEIFDGRIEVRGIQLDSPYPTQPPRS